MESLSEEIWDVVITGTSLPQAFLALALSRSGKKVLHIDRHNYYGGNDAGLSLQDANAWIDERSRDESSIFSNAQISTESHSADELATPRLGPSRAYTLTLNPQIIYAQSGLLPSLVSSQIHTQLEFLAVGSWWIHRNGNLQKIPSSREDVFSDDSLSMKDKRGLMKFLRYVMEDEKTQDELQEDEVGTMQSVLSSRFNISNSLQTPLLALALSTQPVHQTDFQYAVSRIRMHLRSMGYFGTGFGAVVAKYGGNAEIAQVACRACAVGGGVYLLGHGVDNVEPDIIQHSDTEDNSEQKLINVTLSSENMIKARFVVGGLDDIPQIQPRQQTVDTRAARTKYTHTISIISDPLRHLFPQTSDNGPVPAAAIVLVEDEMENAAPIYLQVHSEDTGECPSGQCVIYGSTGPTEETSSMRLNSAIESFLASGPQHSGKILWSMSYDTSHSRLSPPRESWLEKSMGGVNVFDNAPYDVAIDAAILDEVKAIWEKIIGEEADSQSFLRFPEREAEMATPI